MQSSFAQTLWRRRQLGEIKIVEKVEDEDRVHPGMLNITIQVPHRVDFRTVLQCAGVASLCA